MAREKKRMDEKKTDVATGMRDLLTAIMATHADTHVRLNNDVKGTLGRDDLDGCIRDLRDRLLILVDDPYSLALLTRIAELTRG